MKTWCISGRILTLAIAITTSGIVQSQERSETPYLIGGKWDCIATFQNHHYEYSLDVKPVGAKEWTATRTLVWSDDPSAKAGHFTGKILAGQTYTAHYSGFQAADDFTFGEFDGTSEISAKNANPKNWEFKFSVLDTNLKPIPFTWSEQCTKPTDDDDTPAPQTKTVVPTPSHAVSEGRPAPNPPTPSPSADSGAAALLHDQLKTDKSGGRKCDKNTVATVFGYFTSTNEIDLSKGAKDIDLEFQPYVFPNGNTLGQAIDSVMAKSHLQFQPSLSIGHDFSEVPTGQPIQPLNPVNRLSWQWKVDQSWWSSAEETDASIIIGTIPALSSGSLITLPVKVKGKPWWWLLPWFWENVLGKPEVSLVLLVFLVIASRKGVKAAWQFLWRRVIEGAGGD